jgi:hypothetical protein
MIGATKKISNEEAILIIAIVLAAIGTMIVYGFWRTWYAKYHSNLPEPRAEGGEIRFITQKRYQADSYATPYRMRFVIDGFKEFIREHRKDGSPSLWSPGLFISSSLFGKFVPVADIDGEKGLITAKAWIKEYEGVGYVIMESNPGKFWLFIDKPTGDMNEAIRTAAALPGTDNKYNEFCTAHKVMNVRAIPKLDRKDERVAIFSPTITYISPGVSDLLRSLCNQIEDHFNSLEFRWYKTFHERLNNYHTGRVPSPLPSEFKAIDAEFSPYLLPGRVSE